MLKKGPITRNAFVLGGVLLAGLGWGRPVVAQEPGEQAMRQIKAILADKATWTPTEQKLATSLLMAHRESRGQPMIPGLGPFPNVAARAGVDAKGMVVVDIKAKVTDTLLRTIVDVGGEVISSYPSYEAVRARVPIRRVDTIAGLAEVRFVGPKQVYILNTGSVTSQGDAAHAATLARSNFSLDGTGVRVGVLSDGVTSLADRQTSLDLPPTCASPPPASGACVAVLPGTPCDPLFESCDEGTAMMEIIHDLAPGAQLFFASAEGGPAEMATQIQTLRNTYGCDIIVDDVTYLDEGAFQDGPIAKAVNAVKASGALYFSSAGNSGGLNAGTSGTWEGDFFPTCWYIGSPPGAHLLHGFDGQACNVTLPPSDQLTATPGLITLKWSDPLGASANDYDLLLYDSTFSNLLDVSATTQNGAQDPFEIMFTWPPSPGDRIVVVKYSGASRALRVDTNRGRLSIATAGAVVGHNGAESTITVAATDGRTPGPGNPFTGGAANPVEPYSSDGPRRMFFNPDGSAITPANVLFGTNGGRVLRKPDITAADCVSVTTPDFTPFCGTSAAAPHAAAIAALLKSAPNKPSGDQALTAMFTTALDVNPPAGGRDRDSGVGIVMANPAANALINVPNTSFYTLNPCRVLDTRAAGGPTAGAPLTCGTDQTFTIAGTCSVPASAKAISLNVTVTGSTAGGNLRLFAAGAPPPQVSALNYAAGQTRGNNAVGPLSASGKIAVRCSPSGTTHVIVDVNGYFQ
jgi:hypothetical protein